MLPQQNTMNCVCNTCYFLSAESPTSVEGRGSLGEPGRVSSHWTLRKLPVVQIRVFSIACQQLFVSAALDNLSLVYDDDCGGVADSRETVRNDERGAPLE